MCAGLIPMPLSGKLNTFDIENEYYYPTLVGAKATAPARFPVILERYQSKLRKRACLVKAVNAEYQAERVGTISMTEQPVFSRFVVCVKSLLIKVYEL